MRAMGAAAIVTMRPHRPPDVFLGIHAHWQRTAIAGQCLFPHPTRVARSRAREGVRLPRDGLSRCGIMRQRQPILGSTRTRAAPQTKPWLRVAGTPKLCGKHCLELLRGETVLRPGRRWKPERRQVQPTTFVRCCDPCACSSPPLCRETPTSSAFRSAVRHLHNCCWGLPWRRRMARR